MNIQPEFFRRASIWGLLFSLAAMNSENWLYLFYSSLLTSSKFAYICNILYINFTLFFLRQINQIFYVAIIILAEIYSETPSSGVELIKALHSII
jgi:hypothetical protein